MIDRPNGRGSADDAGIEPLDADLRNLLDDVARTDALDEAFGPRAEARVLRRVEGSVHRKDTFGRSVFGLRSALVVATVGAIAVVAGTRYVGNDPSSSSRSGHSTTPENAAQPSIATYGASDERPVTPSAPATVEDGAPTGPGAVPSFHVDDLPTSTVLPAAVPRPSAERKDTSTVPSGASRDEGGLAERSGTKAENGTLAEEYRLVEGARAELAAKHHSPALRSIEEHERRFPNGQLRQENESLHIQVLVETGRIAEARERAERFHSRYPNGLLAPSVTRAIASSAPAPALP